MIMTEFQIEKLKELKRYFENENETCFQCGLRKDQALYYYYLTNGQRLAMEMVLTILGIEDEQGEN